MRKSQINKLMKYSKNISDILNKIEIIHTSAFLEHDNKSEKWQKSDRGHKSDIVLECVDDAIAYLEWAIESIKDAKEINED